MKKKGVTLIETIVSLMILMLVVTLFLTIVKEYNTNLHARKVKERLSRLSYCIMNELKYNCTKENIISQSSNNKIQLKNYDDILDDLKYKSLFELEKGDGITVLFNNNEALEINVTIYEDGFTEERNFIKWR